MNPHTTLLRSDWQREITALVAQAREQLARLERELAELDRLERELLTRHATLCPWDTAQLRVLRVLELQLPGRRQELEARAENVISLLGRALELDPEHSGARAKLADLFWLLFSRAEERGELEQQQRYLELLALHDDGRYADLVEGTGTLQVESDPPGARVRLQPVGPEGVPRELGCTPLPPLDLEPGSYLLLVELAGHAPTRRPIQVHRGADLQLQLRLFPAREVGPDFQYIPAGRFRMGGDPAAPGAGPLTQPFVDNFALARFPVTVGEYGLFLDDLSGRDPGRALRFTPLPQPAPLEHDPRLPVSGIPYEAAEAYCAWLSARTGLEHRLPTETEWEKAARGVDGRAFPWGEVFDATRCHMRRSQAGPPRKARVGSVVDDTSVYGVRDLAGGVAEWTSTPFGAGQEPALQVVRGGGYDDGAESCRCAARIPCSHEARPGVGLRLVRPLPPGGGDRISAAPIPSLPAELELPELAASDGPDPVTSPMLPLGESMAQISGMASRLASGDAATLLPELLAEIVRLCHAERGLLLTGAEPTVIEARTGQGEPVPVTDQGFDAPVARAALKQQRPILLEHPHPVLAVPLPCGERCLLLERRFHRSAPFSEDCLLLARSATEPLALAHRLALR